MGGKHGQNTQWRKDAKSAIGKYPMNLGNYLDTNLKASVFYVLAYREMWDEQKPDKGPLDGEIRKTGLIIPDSEGDHKETKVPSMLE